MLLTPFCMAQISGFSGPFLPDTKGLDVSPAGGLLAPFKYVAPSKQDETVEPKTIQRSPSHQKIADLNASGNYQAAGTEGLKLLSTDKVDEELQLIIANSLAWTGRINQAVPAYQGISKGQYAKEANIGLANINRWRGRDDLALPIYQSVLEIDSTNADALEGIEMAQRELSPRTTFGATVTNDSSDLKRRLGFINHRWRDQSGTNIYEVEASGFTDWMPGATANQQDLSFRYQGLALPLKPNLEVNVATRLNPRLYAVGRIKVLDDQLSIGAGRINWGKSVTNPNSSIFGWSANYVGLELRESFYLGQVTARADFYGISDGNSVVTSSVNLDTAWRPLGSRFKPFVGVETRSAKFNTSNYWSPDQGYGSAYAGLLGEWSEAEWNIYASAQFGAPLFGDAGHSWSVSLGGKRWFSADTAVNFSLWSMASTRNSSAYRAQAINLNLEKLWR